MTTPNYQQQSTATTATAFAMPNPAALSSIPLSIGGTTTNTLVTPTNYAGYNINTATSNATATNQYLLNASMAGTNVSYISQQQQAQASSTPQTMQVGGIYNTNTNTTTINQNQMNFNNNMNMHR